MPDMYADGEYDLAGFCVGMADNAKIVDGSGIRVGDVLIGLASSGIHSNGYSLVRKILDKSGLGPDDTMPGSDRTVKDVLLEPTYIYSDVVRNLMRDLPVKGWSISRVAASTITFPASCLIRSLRISSSLHGMCSPFSIGCVKKAA